MKTMNFVPGKSAVIAAAFIGVLYGCGGEKPEAMVGSAKSFLAKQDTKSAVIQLRNALQKDPNLAEARFLLGKTLLATGDFPTAEKEFRRAMELEYAVEQTVPALAQAVLYQGEAGKVVREFGQMDLKSADAKADLLATLGTAHAMLGKPDSARMAFLESLHAVPDNSKAMLGMARLSISSNELPEAERLVGTVLGKSPDLVEALSLKAGLLIAQGKLDEGIKVHEKIIDLKPDNVRNRFTLFALLVRGNRLEAAAGQAEAMKKSAPKDPLTNYSQALLAYLNKNPGAAREAIQQVLQIAPGHVPSLLLAGMVEYQLGAYDQAEANLRKAIEQAPKNIFARRVLTQTYIRMGQPGRAVETIRPALDLAPNSPAVLLAAGEAHLFNNDIDSAAKFYEKAAANDGKSSLARTRLAMTRLAHGDTDAGLRELEAASALDQEQIQADIALIAAHLRKNDPDKALKAIAALEKKQPKNPLAQNLRATALLQKKDTAGARKSLEHALELQPTYFPAAMALAMLDFQEKNFDAARKRLTDLLEKDPKNQQALLALSQFRQETGAAPKDVLEPIERAVSGNPQEIAPRLALIRYYMGQKDIKKALSVAQDAQAAIPDKPRILDLLGQLQLAAGDANQALSTFNKAVLLQPKSPLPLIRAADAAMAANNSQEAQQVLKKALALDPVNGEALRRLGVIHVASAKYDEALALARSAQKQAPKSPIGWLLEGDVFAAQRKWSEAAGVFHAGLKKFNSADFVVREYEVWMRAEKNAEAEKVANEWLRANPKDAFVRIFLAERAIRQRQYAPAVQQYKAILQNSPENVAILNNLAWASGQLKDPKAIEYAEKALALQPNNPAVMDTLGMLLVERGHPLRGLELLQKALAAAPEAYAIRLNLAKALASAGQKEEAKRALDPLLRLGDKFPGKDEAAALMKTL